MEGWSENRLPPNSWIIVVPKLRPFKAIRTMNSSDGQVHQSALPPELERCFYGKTTLW